MSRFERHWNRHQIDFSSFSSLFKGNLLCHNKNCDLKTTPRMKQAAGLFINEQRNNEAQSDQYKTKYNKKLNCSGAYHL